MAGYEQYGAPGGYGAPPGYGGYGGGYGAPAGGGGGMPEGGGRAPMPPRREGDWNCPKVGLTEAFDCERGGISLCLVRSSIVAANVDSFLLVVQQPQLCTPLDLQQVPRTPCWT
jgi:hypothetical protein